MLSTSSSVFTASNCAFFDLEAIEVTYPFYMHLFWFFTYKV
ncbi:hypothetical protein BACI349Y_40138 [Bacillus sp. 349Y]|nr:hypothetical protein BACI349Y_40138 [Bacillus sp. 349Y]